MMLFSTTCKLRPYYSLRSPWLYRMGPIDYFRHSICECGQVFSETTWPRMGVLGVCTECLGKHKNNRIRSSKKKKKKKKNDEERTKPLEQILLVQ